MGKIRTLVGSIAVALLVAGMPARAAETCASYAPFGTIAGAQLTPTNFTSKDGVSYVMFRGIAPSFDGMPMSVDVTIPCSASGPIPLVVMNHGWTDDKTIWEETGRSDTVDSPTFRPGSNSHWNNIWFASRGYAVLNYTARGWHDSCGPGTPGAIAQVAPASACLAYKYWIHTDDLRWEIRDAQWLTAALVESSVADANKLAITGGSYGGGVTIMSALLNDRIVCGGAPQSIGTDPCAGKSNGAYSPWETQTGRRLRWAVALPMYTWGDVIQALLPNGRGSDDEDVADGDHADPVGVPIESYIVGLYAAAQPLGNGFVAPPGIDDTSDVTIQSARTLAGDPFLAQDPIAANGIHQFRDFKSAINIVPDGTVPIFWTQGFTDPLFTAFEPLQIANKLRRYDPDYPIKLFFGDLGHDYAAERIDEWSRAHELMNAFLSHYLAGEGDAPTFDVTATITRCLNHDDPAEFVTAPTWGALHPLRASVTTPGSGITLSEAMSPVGVLTDPVSTASIPGPQSYKGCRIVRPALDDPNAVTTSWKIDTPLTMIGAPVISVDFIATGPNAELNVRLWDVLPDGSAQGLVTRGTYRVAQALDAEGHARFEIAPQGYRFGAGHTIKSEITANDAPYRQPANSPSQVIVNSVRVTLPVR